MVSRYWFSGWLEANDIRSSEELHRVLSKTRGLESLLSAVPPTVYDQRPESSASYELVGGKGIDLTGKLGCNNVDCLGREINELFRHAWHYFDRVVVPDRALMAIEEFKGHENFRSLLWHLDALLAVIFHLQALRIDDLVSFEARAPSCERHWEDHAIEAEIEQSIVNVDQLVNEFDREANIKWNLVEVEDHWHAAYELGHPLLEHLHWNALCMADSLIEDGNVLRRAICKETILTYMRELSADAVAARRLRSPLGTTILLYRRLLKTTKAPTVSDVAFELEFPVLENVPIEVLIALRRSEGPAFDRLQIALSTAIDERLKAVGDEDPSRIADEIRDDIIRPELNNIRDRLEAAKRVAIKNSISGVALGAAATTVGLLSPLPGTVTTSLDIGGTFFGLQAIHKAWSEYTTEKAKVSLSNMYFLWKAHVHAPNP